jgi:hypothetical protein
MNAMLTDRMTGEDGCETPNTPLAPGHPLVGERCPFCRQPFESGDVTKTAPGGPPTRAEYAKARWGLPYVCSAPFELHYDCGDPKGSGWSIR